MKFQLNLQTITTSGVGTLRSLKPNSKGFYEGVPLAVLGAVSRNNMYYEPQSVVDAMGKSNTRFFKAISGGALDGEWGHPDITNMTDDKALHRIALVKESQISHYFNHIYLEDTADGKFQVIKGDVKATGPYGKYLKESFEDEHHDTGFSLRSLTSSPVRRNDGVGVKKVMAMITFDTAMLPGYEQASKRGVAMEGLDLAYEDDEVRVMETSVLAGDVEVMDSIGYESVDCQEVLDILQANEVEVSFDSKCIGVYDSDMHSLTKNGSGRKISPFHSIFGA